MPRILHFLEHLKADSTTRSLISVASWSSQLHALEHAFAVLKTADPEAASWADDAGIEIIMVPDFRGLDTHIASADIVQVEYFNTPAVNDFLRRHLPEMRLAVYSHVTGHHIPDVFPGALAVMADVSIASNAALYAKLAAGAGNTDEPAGRHALILPAVDCKHQLAGFDKTPHSGFHLGYVNPAGPEYLHPQLIDMSTAVSSPDAAFFLYGEDPDGHWAQKIGAHQATGRFQTREIMPDAVQMLQHLDVFGYPIHPNALPSELPYLQLAMWAGLPVVVLAHDCVNDLIKHNETGLIARNAEDFTRSIAYLYNNPVERDRLGLNASIYARTHLGTQNAAYAFKRAYDFMLTLPKRNHAWGCSPYRQHETSTPVDPPPAAQQFIDALDGDALAFEISMGHAEEPRLLEAEQMIAEMTPDMFAYLAAYARYADTDPYLRLWTGLYLEHHPEAAPASTNAVAEFAAALEQGLAHWRVEWYLARTLYQAGKIEESKRIYTNLRHSIPEFETLTGDERFRETQRASLEFTIAAPPVSPAEDAAAEELTPETVDEAALEPAPAGERVRPIRVSAIVSTYAAEAFIDGCLHDLVSQSLFQKGELEIIVIDAASPENEEEIVERYQANFDNIHYVRTPEREPLYASWNRGIRMANGDYITSANTDDRHRKDALECLAGYLDAHPEFALLYAGQIDTSVPNESFETTSSVKMLNWPPYSYAELERHCIIGSQPMWRKSMHEKHGFFREDLKSAGDYEFWLRIGRHETFYRYPDTLGLYFRNPEGIEHGSQISEQETLQIWQEYGMFDRGVPVILNGRIIRKARTPVIAQPEHTAPAVQPPFDVYVTQYEEALFKNDLETALAVAESATQDYGTLPYPLILKAIVLRQQGKFDEALTALGASIERDETPEALVELVQLAIATDQEDEARRTTAYIEEKYPEWKQRIETLKKSLMEDTTAPASRPAQLDDLDYSMRSFTALKEQFEMLLRTKDIGRAEALAGKAILNFPDNHEAWVLKATSDRLKGAYRDAREAIHKSQLIEDSPEALIELFQVSQATGDKEEAKNIATQFDEAYPDFSATFRELFPDAV